MTVSTVGHLGRHVTAEDFEAVVHRIGTALGTHRHDLTMAYRVAHENLVAGESCKPLAGLARLLLGAPYALHCNVALNQLRQTRDARGRLTPSERESWRQLRPIVCGYNHQLTIFIDRYRSLLRRRGLFDWLVSAAGYRDAWLTAVRVQWAGRIMVGCTGEVVAADILRRLVRGLRHGSVTADLERGTDFEFEPTAAGICTADIKAGAACRAEPVVRCGSHIVLSIRSEHIDGFYLKAESEAYYHKALSSVL